MRISSTEDDYMQRTEKSLASYILDTMDLRDMQDFILYSLEEWLFDMTEDEFNTECNRWYQPYKNND